MNNIIKALTQIFKQFSGSYEILDGKFCLNYGPGNCSFLIDSMKTPEYWPKFMKALELAAGRFTGPDLSNFFTIQAPETVKPYTLTKKTVWLTSNLLEVASEINKSSMKAKIIEVPGLENYTILLTPGKSSPCRVLFNGLTFTDTLGLGVGRDQFISEFITKLIEHESKGALMPLLEKMYQSAMKKRNQDQAPEIGAPAPVTVPAKAEKIPVVRVSKTKGPGPIREYLESPENQIDFWEWDVKAMYREIESGKETLTIMVDGFYYQGGLKIIETDQELYEVQFFETGEVLEMKKDQLVPGLSTIIQTGTIEETYRKKLIEYFNKK
jgi:hypothetical protein